MSVHFDLVDLRLMVRVAEANSLTKGAEASHISLPAASTRIKNLEESIGAKLLNRHSQGVTLTPPGQAFVHRARLVLGQIEHLRGDLQEYASGIKGHLRVYANTTALGEFLPEVLKRYLATHPDVNIDLQEKLSNEIVRAVIDGKTDIGIVAGSVRTESLQTFGGSGFLQDYPVEQYIRDAKIDSLYEGTTAIQAQDFFFRKIIRDKGVALAHVAGQIEEFVRNESGNGRLKTERALLAKALEDVQGMAATLTGYLMAAQEDPQSIYKVGLGSVRFLMSMGDLVMGWLLLRQSAVAIAALDAGVSDADQSFYEGKIAAASFFAKNFLPLLVGTRQVIEALDNEVMELDEAAF